MISLRMQRILIILLIILYSYDPGKFDIKYIDIIQDEPEKHIT